jgi:DNA-binding CsgD family transcriptional regulator
MSGAHEQFLGGDFEGCLGSCDTIVVRDDAMHFELALLRARVLLRLDRADRAVEALLACAFTPISTDGLVTAEMLLGTAYLRLGQHERGEELLSQAEARSSDAHPTIRAELTLHRGIAKYLTSRHDEADALLASVPPEADMIRARALEYRGWIEFTRGRFDIAALRFRAAFDCIGLCRWRDRFVEANVLLGLCTLSAEMMDTAAWEPVELRVRAFDWNAAGLGRPRFWVAMYCSMMSELLGDDERARAWSRQAELDAPNIAYRAIALCQTASVFRGLRESRAHLEFALRARIIYEAMDPSALGPDQKQLPLFIAEELAYGRAPEDAARLLKQYREVIAPMLRAVAGDERYAALEELIDGSLADARGDRNAAVRSYTRALSKFRKLGYRRRAAAVALRLARMTGSNRYRLYAASTLTGADPRFWMAQELRSGGADRAPMLTDRQRIVLTLVAEGKTYKEIGVTLGRSWKTISNTVEQLRAKFGTGTRGELVAVAMRRGTIGGPNDPEASRSA